MPVVMLPLLRGGWTECRAARLSVGRRRRGRRGSPSGPRAGQATAWLTRPRKAAEGEARNTNKPLAFNEQVQLGARGSPRRPCQHPLERPGRPRRPPAVGNARPSLAVSGGVGGRSRAGRLARLSVCAYMCVRTCVSVCARVFVFKSVSVCVCMGMEEPASHTFVRQNPGSTMRHLS